MSNLDNLLNLLAQQSNLPELAFVVKLFLLVALIALALMAAGILDRHLQSRAKAHAPAPMPMQMSMAHLHRHESEAPADSWGGALPLLIIIGLVIFVLVK